MVSVITLKQFHCNDKHDVSSKFLGDLYLLQLSFGWELDVKQAYVSRYRAAEKSIVSWLTDVKFKEIGLP